MAQRGATGGYDSALGDPRCRYGPANTGLLVWYNNDRYTDNEVCNYLNDFPGSAPRARCWWSTPIPSRTAIRHLVAAG